MLVNVTETWWNSVQTVHTGHATSVTTSTDYHLLPRNATDRENSAVGRQPLHYF